MTAKKTTDDVTLIDPATFDVEAWLSCATLPEAKVKVCANQTAKVELDALEGDDLTSDRMVSPNTARITELKETVAAATVEFRVRAIKPSEAEAIDNAHPVPAVKEGDAENEHARNAAMIAQQIARVAAQIITPPMTTEQVRALREGIGDAAFTELFATCMALNNGRLISPPTSPASSTTNAG